MAMQTEVDKYCEVDEYRANLDSIQLLAVVQVSHIQRYGIDAILSLKM